MVAALLWASHVVGLIGCVLRAVRVLEGLEQRAEAIVVSIGLSADLNPRGTPDKAGLAIVSVLVYYNNPTWR